MNRKIISYLASILIIISVITYTKKTKYYDFNKPFLIKNSVHLKDINKFNPENLLDKIGNKEVIVYEHNPKNNPKYPQQELKMLFKDFYNKNFIMHERYRYQIKNNFDSLNKNEILEILSKYIEKIIGKNNDIEYTIRLCHTPWEYPCHFDASDNLFIQLFGKRKVILIPFEIGIKFENQFDTHPQILQNQEIKSHSKEIILEPRDILFIPAGWFHYFISIDSNFLVACSTAFKIPQKTKIYEHYTKKFIKAYPTQNLNILQKKEFKNIKN